MLQPSHNNVMQEPVSVVELECFAQWFTEYGLERFVVSFNLNSFSVEILVKFLTAVNYSQGPLYQPFSIVSTSAAL